MAHRSPLRSWLLLRAVPGLGDASYCRLIDAFGSPEAVFSAAPDQLAAVDRVGPSLARAIRSGPDAATCRAIDEELASLESSPFSWIVYSSPEYPARLKSIPDPPPILYMSGGFRPEDRHAVAVVGSRKATPGGRAFTLELSRELASLGFTIVSGLARGIDAAAHRGALEAKGRTIAVLGCGVDKTYPSEHRALRREIESAGAVLSELPLGAPPHSYHFPRRNRVISGLCLGVIVVEATLQSGSLITARLAADQGREVFAVPGFVKAETSRGPHALLKQGAALVERVEDVLQELLPQLDAAIGARVEARTESAKVQRPEPEGKEVMLYRFLSWEAAHIDALIERSGLTPAEVSGLLLSLELKGLLRQLPGQCYVRL
ncbi:DNA-processing protein DprA [Candidatus Nitrospira bockiana]